MKNREVYLSEDEALVAAATRIWNLDFSNPIVALDIEVKGVFFADGMTYNPLMSRCVTKIEVVDGSDVLFSMDMREAQALQYYSKNGLPEIVMNCQEDGINRSHVKIHFGRDDSDNEWMLDPAKFVNPQLKITYALPITVAGGWKDGNQTISVKGLICENPVTAPVGFLMGKEIYEWASAAGDETIDMPRDYLYRLMILRCYDTNYGLHTQMSKIKMSCDIDRFVPFNIDGRDLRLKEVEEYGTGLFHCKTECDGAALCYCWNPWGNVRMGSVGSPTATNAPVIIGFSPRRINVRNASGAEIGDNEEIETLAHGMNLNDCCPYSFGNLRDAQEFLDPTPYKSVRLIVTQGGTADLLQGIVLQQVRIY